MQARYKTILMWSLYGLLVLLSMTVQTVILGHTRVLGTKFALLPVVLACITMHLGAEKGGLFGLVVGTVWCLSGADGGGMNILSMTAAALCAGYLCDRYLNRNILAALLMSLLSLLIVQGALFFIKAYLASAGIGALGRALLQTVLSLPTFLVYYPIVWAIQKLDHSSSL